MKNRFAATLLAPLLLAATVRAQDGFKAGDAYIRKHDVNGDYRVHFPDEVKDAEAFKKVDRNGDGYITIGDFLQKSASSNEDRMMMMNAREVYRYYGFQTIAKYDRNSDAVLDDDEMRFLLMAVLDYDEDRVLNPAEMRKSRAPPGLALEEGWFAKEAKAMDANGDTIVTMAELRVPEIVMRPLDRNHDGKVSLEELAKSQLALVGGYLPRYHELSDTIGKLQKLDKANWQGDPDVFHKLDQDQDSAISLAEFDRYSRSLKAVLSLIPDFVSRHDLDGDQKVVRREFPGTDSMFARLDKNRDGVVTSQDR
jgi:Ca2+-binding EF-hand superfamily protein